MKRKKPNRSYVPLSPQKLRRRTLAKRRLIWELTLCGNRLLGTLPEAIQLGCPVRAFAPLRTTPCAALESPTQISLSVRLLSGILVVQTFSSFTYYGSLTPGFPLAVDLPNMVPHTTKHTFGKLAN